jgi:hypothetical protein
MQLMWMSLGLMLVFLQICRYIGKSRISYIFFLYFFSGLKIIECFLYLPIFGDGNIIHNTAIILAQNSSPGAFHAGPIVQFFYDPINQTVPLFLCMIIILNNKKNKFIPFIYSLLLFYAPFPFAGLAPIVLYLFIRNITKQPIEYRIKYIFSFENFVSLTIIIIVALYLTSNINNTNRGLRPTNNIIADIYDFLIYIIFEFAIYIAFGYKACKDKLLLWIAFGSVCIFGWFQIGLHNDFCFRTNMPLIFIISLLVMKRYYMKDVPSWAKKAIITCYIIGGIPAQIHPSLRLLSSYFIAAGQKQEVLNNYQHFIDVRKLYVMQQTEMRNDDLKTCFLHGRLKIFMDNYKGETDAFFFKYLMKSSN